MPSCFFHIKSVSYWERLKILSVRIEFLRTTTSINAKLWFRAKETKTKFITMFTNSGRKAPGRTWANMWTTQLLHKMNNKMTLVTYFMACLDPYRGVLLLYSFFVLFFQLSEGCHCTSLAYRPAGSLSWHWNCYKNLTTMGNILTCGPSESASPCMAWTWHRGSKYYTIVPYLTNVPELLCLTPLQTLKFSLLCTFFFFFYFILEVSSRSSSALLGSFTRASCL